MTTVSNSGHPGGSLSSADIIAALYFKVMKHNPNDPQWDERDRFVLSKGHAAPVLYAALAESGYFSSSVLHTFRQVNSRLQGHPVHGKTPGIEMSTGSLGQGLSMSCGIALSAKMDGKNYKTYCLLGDGELQSGQNWEAAMFASNYKLNNLIAIVDRNHLQNYGSTEEIMALEPLGDKWKSFGFNVIEADGHDMIEILKAFETASKSTDAPTVIIFNTIKGKGVSFMENNVSFHGRACNPDEYKLAMTELSKAIQ